MRRGQCDSDCILSSAVAKEAGMWWHTTALRNAPTPEGVGRRTALAFFLVSNCRAARHALVASPGACVLTK